MREASETERQAAILDYLRLRGHLSFRLNNTPVSFVDKHGERRFRSLGKYAMKGIPDIVLINYKENGRFYGIEVKAETGRLSDEQKEFQRLCEKHGGVYIVARSIDDVAAHGL